ncbi:MAG: hypothetical protein JO327_03405 [Nitrososphaeraceae archaeon]|nr:hypothetical protein [Nitrososphaeraceae archaeon]MBV9667157.1 hypothetical protein [Nitrososphaeraceae archaeon]
MDHNSCFDQENALPTANAGSSQIVSPRQNVILDGSDSLDPDSNNLYYYWYQKE